MLAVVSLPAFFVFRPSGADPHPMPYLRVLISAGVGAALYPHPQWEAMGTTWKPLYPIDSLPPGRRAEIERIEATIGSFVDLLLHHRSPRLRGRRLGDIFPLRERHPTQLLRLHHQWQGDFAVMARQPPSLVFAVIGQAKASGLITAEDESTLLTALLSAWAVRGGLDVVRRPVTATAPPARRAS